MATNDRHSGTLRTDYETDPAQLHGLPAMESNWQRLLHRLARYSKGLEYRDDDGQEGTLAPLLENHVLTVVADLMRKRLSGYDGSFADAQGTTGESEFHDKLETDIRRWTARLEAFIDKSWRMGLNESPAVTVAVQLRDSLKKSLPVEDEAEKHGYYRMLRTVRSIQEHAGYYLEQIENGGDVDGALSLLIAYVRNYCSLADTFNQRLPELHTLYQTEILHVKPGEVVPDKAYIVVRPTEICTLKAGQGFLAGQNAGGEDLIYRTDKAETVSPLQCTEADAVYLLKNGDTTGIRRQTIIPDNIVNAAPLFDTHQGEPLSFGWQIESPMFILNEGKREVTVTFHAESIPGSIPLSTDKVSGGFSFYMSHADGWQELSGQSSLTSDGLCFRFTIEQDGILPSGCNEEIHGKTTGYPVLRIQTHENSFFPLNAVSQLEISGAEIQVHVTGIRNFTFYNELGEVDTTLPFQPFGIQAECGAWFLFGNEEMGMKPLTEVMMKGFWQKMPETVQAFNERYKDYKDINASQFKVSTQWQQGGKWMECSGEPQQLLAFDDTEKTWRAHILFDFEEQRSQSRSLMSHYEYSRDKDGFFRVRLQSPPDGFGEEAYRRKYTETMIHNSRCKEKQQKEIPQEPVTPVLSDVELEYSAAQRLTDIPKAELFMTSDFQETRFKSRMDKEKDKSLYFAFVNARGLQSLRMYLDMAIPPCNIPYDMPKTNGTVSLVWEYRKENSWMELPSKAITVEETCGFTQSGFIEIRLPEKISDKHTDRDGKTWLRAAVKGDAGSCLGIRGVWTNCIPLTAQNGDGLSLAAGTIKDMQEPDGRIALVSQPLPGFGGKQAEGNNHLSSHLRARFGNRHRAVNRKDYEQLVLEHFPEVDKAVCIPCTDKGTRQVRLVVFSAGADSVYYLSPSWKLREIERALRQFAPPFVRLEVLNPVYEELKVVCKAVLREEVADEGKVVRNLITLAWNYLAPWKRRGTIPELQQTYSYKELHARMANHEDLQTVVELTAGGHTPGTVDFDSSDYTIKGTYPYSVLIPKIEIILLSPDDGIESTEIGSSFIIK